MPNKAKITLEQKIEIINSFFLERLQGDTTRKIKYESLAAFANERYPGYHLKEYDFRRYEEIQKHIQDLQTGRIVIAPAPSLPPYMAMGKKQISRQIQENPMSALSICEKLDAACQNYSNEMCRLQQKCLSLSNQLSQFSQEKSILEASLREARIQAQTSKPAAPYASHGKYEQELKSLRSQLSAASRFIQTCVMKDIATLLMKEKKPQWDAECAVIDTGAIQRIMEGMKPEAIPPITVFQNENVENGEENGEYADVGVTARNDENHEYDDVGVTTGTASAPDSVSAPHVDTFPKTDDVITNLMTELNELNAAQARRNM